MNSSDFAAALIATATDFVGLVETTQNRVWDDPKTKASEAAKSELLSKMMTLCGWRPGQPYCAALLSAVVEITASRVGLKTATFREIWTPHCMTNVRRLKARGLLDNQPSNVSLMLMRHGTTDKGHAALCVRVDGVFPRRMLATIEGNTMTGDAGDQRQGDGIYQRARNVFTNGSLITQGWLSCANLLTLLHK